MIFRFCISEKCSENENMLARLLHNACKVQGYPAAITNNRSEACEKNPSFQLHQFMKQPRPKLVPQRAQDMIPYYAAYRNLIWEFYLDFISCKAEDRRGHRWFAREAVAREQRKNYVDSQSVTRALQSHAAKKILSLCHSNICRSSC